MNSNQRSVEIASVMRQALEALEDIKDDCSGCEFEWLNDYPLQAKAAAALRQAIARAEHLEAEERELVCVCGAVWEGDELVESPRTESKREPLTDVLLSDEVVEKAGREWWAQTRRTNGPRTLDQYASQQIMDEVRNTAAIIIAEAIKAAHGITKEKNNG